MDPIWLLAVAGLIGIIIIVVIAIDNRNKRKQGAGAIGGDAFDGFRETPHSRAQSDPDDRSGTATAGILGATAASVAGAGLFDLSDSGDDGFNDD